MKRHLVPVVWYPAAWVIYDMLAYVIGLSRQVTPLVAAAVALGIWALSAHADQVRTESVAKRRLSRAPIFD
jgi:hypothetical protein